MTEDTGIIADQSVLGGQKGLNATTVEEIN